MLVLFVRVVSWMGSRLGFVISYLFIYLFIFSRMTFIKMVRQFLRDVEFVRVISGMSLDIVCSLVRRMFMWYIHIMFYTISSEVDVVTHGRVEGEKQI